MRTIRGETHIERIDRQQRYGIHCVNGRLHSVASIAQTSRTDVQNVNVGNGANRPTHNTMGVIDNDAETTVDDRGDMRDDCVDIVRVHTGNVHGW